MLQILDSAWKEHLLAMDHLRSSVGLRGYAQVDPKVEYKREGMSLFDSMWVSVGNYVTDLIFKMEQLDEGFVGSTWVESAAIKEEARAGQRDRTPAASRHRRHRGRQEARTDPQPANPKSAATTPAPAAAARNTSSAACGTAEHRIFATKNTEDAKIRLSNLL